jgi:hypothetical protein
MEDLHIDIITPFGDLPVRIPGSGRLKGTRPVFCGVSLVKCRLRKPVLLPAGCSSHLIELGNARCVQPSVITRIALWLPAKFLDALVDGVIEGGAARDHILRSACVSLSLVILPQHRRWKGHQEDFVIFVRSPDEAINSIHSCTDFRSMRWYPK